MRYGIIIPREQYCGAVIFVLLKTAILRNESTAYDLTR